nr:immunoglobulin heavy chain junction region [Macaca mulatta]MOY21655.1 immunoglobulin heavy chain junction region [Macaca mulatta]MOY24990.1 immunoglobulin heavy chain junction region [Macaca mulatta]MOY25355.1 immunoglobulin heavy chain junction region [Macaca mulatta]
CATAGISQFDYW